MVVVRPDWAGGASVNPTPVRNKPRPSSPGGNTFNTKPRPTSPGGNTNIAPKPVQYYQPAPVNYYRPPVTYNQAPAYNPPPAGSWSQQPANQNFGGGQAQLMPNIPFPRIAAPLPPPPPPEPPQPIKGGREWFNALTDVSKRNEENRWLGGDSDYAAQIGEYDRALQSFIDRITKRKQLFDQDALDATNATNENEGMAQNTLGEDFAARGLSFSGLFDQSKEENANRFRQARTNIGKIQTANKNEADNSLKDYRSENTIGRGNARRAALQRMAADQALKDANNF